MCSEAWIDSFEHILLLSPEMSSSKVSLIAISIPSNVEEIYLPPADTPALQLSSLFFLPQKTRAAEFSFLYDAPTMEDTSLALGVLESLLCDGLPNSASLLVAWSDALNKTGTPQSITMYSDTSVRFWWRP